LQHADQIRRERNAKRRQQEAEMALTKAASKDDANVLVGNLIGEGHVNYVLMYNMLTGIRIGVSVLVYMVNYVSGLSRYRNRFRGVRPKSSDL
jgi:hypothetical protein